MKIAIFSDTFPPQINGVAQFAYKSAGALVNLGHEVCVFTGHHFKNSGEKFETIIFPSAPFWGYPGERITVPMGLAIKKLKKFKPDVIHTHTPFGAGWEAVLAGKVLGIPIVGTHHTFFDHYLKYVHLDFDFFKKSSWKYTVFHYNRCNLVLSPSNSVAAAFKNFGLKKPIEVFPNFIDTNFFVPVSDKEKEKLKESFGLQGGQSLIYMGRLGYEKSIDIVIRAFALINREIPLTKLMIVGDGVEKQALQKLVLDLGIKDKVIFTGLLRGGDLLRTLQANDVFLTASKSENMPLSVLEAMATGLPVVGVNSLGIPEIVRDNSNGFIVDPDDYEAMAAKTLEILKTKKTLKKFSLASRSLAMDHSEEKVAKSLEEVYKKLILRSAQYK